MLSAANTYIQNAIATIERAMESQAEALDKLAGWVCDSIKTDGVLHIFGAGHSHLVAEDLFWRAGGLAPVNALLDYNLTLLGGGLPTRGTDLERMEGYARVILNNYDLRPGEIFICVSQSGINAGPIEAALEAKSRGLKTVALSSLEQSSKLASRHSSGKRLFEVTDLAIDNCVIPGDACVEIAAGLPRVAPISTVVNCALMQAMIAEVASRLYQDGIEPPVWLSANMPGGDERLPKLMERFGGARLRTK
jgi:uncharacterized phosphosugar-binding protein